MTVNYIAVIARGYLRQGNAIRQVASPSSVLQRFPYAPFNAMVTKILGLVLIKIFNRLITKN